MKVITCANIPPKVNVSGGSQYLSTNVSFHVPRSRTPRAGADVTGAIGGASLRGFGVSCRIVVGCAVHRWLLLPIEREDRPHVRRWYEKLKARPASHQVTLQPLS